MKQMQLEMSRVQSSSTLSGVRIAVYERGLLGSVKGQEPLEARLAHIRAGTDSPYSARALACICAPALIGFPHVGSDHAGQNRASEVSALPVCGRGGTTAV
jgi:hypothetical protein